MGVRCGRAMFTNKCLARAGARYPVPEIAGQEPDLNKCTPHSCTTRHCG
jgi:hypothetical protein